MLQRFSLSGGTPLVVRSDLRSIPEEAVSCLASVTCGRWCGGGGVSPAGTSESDADGDGYLSGA